MLALRPSFFFFFSSRRRHTRCHGDWSSDVCSSDLPLAVMLMVAEMTGNLSLLAPAMIAVALSTALVGDLTIYLSQLPNRASSPAHRVRLAFPLRSSLSVRDAMAPAVVLRTDLALDEARAAALPNGAVVVDV